MNWERHLIKAEGRRGELMALLPVAEFVLDGVFLTKSGEVGCVVKLTPVSFECKDPLEMESVTAGFVSSLAALDSSMRIYQHVCKDPAPTFSCTSPTPRSAYLREHKDEFYSLHTYFTVVYAFEAVRSSNQAEIGRQIQTEARYLLTVVGGVVGGWNGLQGRILLADATFTFLSWLVNFEKRVLSVRLSVPFDLDFQMACSNVDANGALTVGSQFVRVLTLKDLPRNSSVFFLRDLLKITCGMVICTEWKPLRDSVAHRSVRTQRRHVNNSKTSISSGNRVVDGGMTERDSILETAQKEMERGQYLGQFSLTVILYSEDVAALRGAVAATHSVIQKRQGALLEHHGRSALVGWLATIPGNHKYSFRHKRLFALNYGDMSFLFAAATGNHRNEHFGEEALVILQNCHGAPFYFNLHRGGVGHTLFTGRTGTGKTFTTNLIIDNIQKYPNVVTIIFDIMNGYQLLTERLGGTYIQLGEGEKSATINPFSMEPTEDNLCFLFSFVRLLVESDGAGRMSNEEILDLDAQIRQIYRLTPSLRRLGNLVLMPHVSSRLDRWVTRETEDRTRVGQYARLFDNPVDSISMAKITTFNFPEMNTAPEALEALTFYIIHLTNREVRSGGSAPKFVFMDEALSFLRNEETRQFIAHGLMRWRHYNAALMLATQSLSHLQGTVGDSILEQCVTRIFSANPGIDTKAWAERFGMSETEAELIPMLKPAQEILVQGEGVITVKVDEVSQALYSNGPYHKEMRSRLIREHGFEKGIQEMAKQ